MEILPNPAQFNKPYIAVLGGNKTVLDGNKTVLGGNKTGQWDEWQTAMLFIPTAQIYRKSSI